MSVSSSRMGTKGTIALGIPLLILGGALVYGLLAIWPAVAAATAEPSVTAESSNGEEISFFGLFSYTATSDTALILLVVFASALGSYVHAATSFGDYVGNRELRRSWTWWYLLRFWVGIAIALLFYFALRGGFLVADGSSSDLNPYGIAALAGMTGLFSKQAADKLNEVFVTAFRVAPGSGDDARLDSIVSTGPRVTSLDPPKVPSGVTEPQTVTLRGERFVQESKVRVVPPGQAGTERETTYVGPDMLTVELLPPDLAEPGTLQLSVLNPKSGDVSEPKELTVGATGGEPAATAAPENGAS
ncbi:MAG: putative integral rane protein [Thermoleophilia bacterium]|nr:putative integral rane protein [Thermoleophilia bacterium]